LELTNADVAARVQGVAEVCSDVASVAGRRSAIGYPQKNGTALRVPAVYIGDVRCPN
jgi:hypothetical protein